MGSPRLQATLLFLLAATSALPCLASDAPPSLPHISTATYLDQLNHSHTLVQSCRLNPDLCDPDQAPEDEIVERPSNTNVTVRWYWLREALQRSKTAPNRSEILDQTTNRLDQDAADLQAFNTLPQARKQADEILSRIEFREVRQDNYLGQKIAAFFLLLDAFFSRAGNHLPRPAWFASLLAWTLLTLACSGLLIWAWRVRKQQRLVIATDVQTATGLWQKESDNWAERAQTEASRGDWREAVHCLYWSAIVMLEGQKRWRQNRSRTPREYLALLENGSSSQRSLLALTRIFERIWYGLRPAAKVDYERAKAMLEELRAA